jgi:formate dehydrogenase subunit gamma
MAAQSHPDDHTPGEAVHPGDPVRVDRYTAAARVNHWIVAISLILLAISGLALFVPQLFPLTVLFGGGQNTRAFHPWLGVVLFFGFIGLFLRFWKANLWERTDVVWLSKIKEVMTGDDEALPEVGKYNAGQKFVFWSMSFLITVLIVSGLAIWEQYFAEYFTVEQKRIAVVIHAVAAIAAICVWIVHVYAAIWVRGTLSAMTRGQVTGGWAYRHHRRWLRELISGRKVASDPEKPQDRRDAAE